MTKPRRSERFAPVPLRAITDPRLVGKSLHLRVLGAIAAFDQLGANGRGCYASHKKMTEILGCAYTSLSAVLPDLVDWGYLNVTQATHDGRLKVYSVVYTNEDSKFFSGPIVRPQPNELPSPTAERSPRDSSPNGSATKVQKPEESRVSAGQDIGKISCRSVGKITHEMASIDIDAPRSKKIRENNVDGQLARFERVTLPVLMALPRERAVPALLEWSAWLDGVFEDCTEAPHGDPTSGRAFRLNEQVLGLLEDHDAFE